MRLSTSVINQRQIASSLEIQSAVTTAAAQVSSGFRVTKPSDDPIAASQAVLVSQAQADSQKYTTARQTAEASLNLEDTTLDEVVTTLQNIQTKLIQAANTTYSDSDRASLATELQSYKDQLVALANTTDSSGNYIFSGYASGSAAFTVADDGTVSYSGSSSAVSIKISDSLSVTTGDTGNSVFGEDGNSVFDTIDQALAALSMSLDDGDSTEEYSSAMGSVLSTLSNQLDDVYTAQTKLGGKQTTITSLKSQQTSIDVVYSDRKTDLVEADIVAATATYQSLQVMLQANAAVTASMFSMSLFQLNG
ncbi:flagellar hook-associated protein FlgL [Brenneria izadpanahii]|uniref:Flagellar hook-associated protein FlgL n=1 Tax=Brenneria izadpanahii TaxID=2722756 RepID=A0ABX7URQ0_9GAMM|nr:flagellar hook-associated protein FlgL [Brenneria izadpanahii]QTF07975.1 flagellar hook-associated protein FlgL [Brenneria izadpanahii]